MDRKRGNDEKLSIGETAKLLRISIDTLRRWDKSGKFRALRTDGKHRQYLREDIDRYQQDIFAIARNWALLPSTEIPPEQYCLYSSMFQARLGRMQAELMQKYELTNIASLLIALVGEIGNNSFDHNIGNWPDTPGIFFGYDLIKRQIALADRGVGIRATLQRVKPSISSHADALQTAFTEVISGRDPEKRGNGLKFVRQIIATNSIQLIFQTGDAILQLNGGSPDINIQSASSPIRGCLAKITF